MIFQILDIEKYCELHNIFFFKLITPSKAYSGENYQSGKNHLNI